MMFGFDQKIKILKEFYNIYKKHYSNIDTILEVSEYSNQSEIVIPQKMNFYLEEVNIQTSEIIENLKAQLNPII